MSRRLFAVVALCALGAAACVSERASNSQTALVAPGLSNVSAGEQQYLIDAITTLPADLEANVAAIGGRLTGTMPEIGVASAVSADPDFAANAAAIQGIRAVDPDPLRQLVEPDPTFEGVEIDASETPSAEAVFGSTETFRLIQWAPDAVQAPDAWDLGARGAGARIAIIDGGIHSTHIDIAPNLDVARSRSFVAGQNFNQDVGTFWHGTHVAGIAAAPGGNLGTVGIAPEATIIGVKVLHNGSGSFTNVINAILYAATPIAEGGGGADIINMSLGAFFPKSAGGAPALKNAIAKAVAYAYQRGVLVVSSAGNEATDYDHTDNLTHIPSDAPHSLSISATGPFGWALGATDLDRPASYTNFGQSTIDFAAGGGDFALPGTAVCSKPRLPTGSVAQQCWVFDMVMAPVRGGAASNSTYSWAAGTSMSAPVVSGVAALIIGKFGKMSPTALEARLRASADDLGKPGNDDFYGAGRVNALRAIQ